jgi:hypothetical protein
MLTFEGQKFQGTQAIVAKLAQLPFNQAKVTCTSMDFQPSVAGGIMVFVTGSIQVCVLLRHYCCCGQQFHCRHSDAWTSCALSGAFDVFMYPCRRSSSCTAGS